MPSSSPPPTLSALRTEDLFSAERLFALSREAVARKLLRDSEGALLDFFRMARLSLRVGEKPEALFRSLLWAKKFSDGTLEDEDQANAMLKEFLRRKRFHFLRRKSPEKASPPHSTGS